MCPIVPRERCVSTVIRLILHQNLCGQSRHFLSRTSQLSHRLPAARSDYTKKLGAGGTPAKREAPAGGVTAPPESPSAFKLAVGRRLDSSVLLSRFFGDARCRDLPGFQAGVGCLYIAIRHGCSLHCLLAFRTVFGSCDGFMIEAFDQALIRGQRIRILPFCFVPRMRWRHDSVDHINVRFH